MMNGLNKIQNKNKNHLNKKNDLHKNKKNKNNNNKKTHLKESQIDQGEERSEKEQPRQVKT